MRCPSINVIALCAISMPIHLRPFFSALSRLVPQPQNGPSARTYEMRRAC